MAQILPLPNFQPLDSNGAILPSGYVYTYVVGTTTPKTTWQDAAQSTANINPVPLDSSGSALIYGDGAYRLQIYNANNVLVRDMVSASWISTLMQPITDGATVATAQGLFGVRTTGQCRLTYTSAIQLTLVPYNGNFLTINGTIQTVPSGGVTLSNAGLTLSTLYYVYAFMSASVMTLEASTTAYAVSTADGTYIKTADATRALVGMVYVNGTTQFDDSLGKRNVASWFNRRIRNITGASTGGANTNSAVVVEIATAARVEACVWADDDIWMFVNGTVAGSASPTAPTVNIGRDGAVTTLIVATINPTIPTATYLANTAGGASDTPAEGRHFWTPLAAVAGGNTIAVFLTLQGTVRN